MIVAILPQIAWLHKVWVSGDGLLFQRVVGHRFARLHIELDECFGPDGGRGNGNELSY